jgi:hypothetical protein
VTHTEKIEKRKHVLPSHPGVEFILDLVEDWRLGEIESAISHNGDSHSRSHACGRADSLNDLGRTLKELVEENTALK